MSKAITKAQDNDTHGPAESILITMESNLIQMKTVNWSVLFVWFFG
jgi:hypothetical protein